MTNTPSDSPESADSNDGSGRERDRDWDAEWAALAADLDDGSATSAPAGTYRVGDRPAFGAGSGPRDYTPAPEDDSWEPPTPPPATGSRATQVAWAGIIGGPAMLMLALIAFRSAPLWYVGLAIAVFVAGCVIGFRELPRRRQDPFDDGAEV